MTRDPQNGLQCSQFEALLADALDLYLEGGQDAVGAGSTLTAGQRRAFEAHRVSCDICGPMFAEVQQGMALLRGLPDVDPPKNLVHNILARTSRAEEATETAGAVAPASGARRWLNSLRPTFRVLLHSRFATSFAMAFFSLSLTLTLAGVKITDLAKVDWHPSALRKSVVLQFNNVEASVMRYYDNLRWVYEVQSRVQQFKKASAPQNNNDKNNKPEQQNRNRPLPGKQDRQEKQEHVFQEINDPPQQAENRIADPDAGDLTAPLTRVEQPQYAKTARAGDPGEQPQYAKTARAGDPGEGAQL
jgi:hypothetical protein